MRAFLVSMLSILLLHACAENRRESICKENGEVRPCNSKEQEVIDRMHTIISGIANYHVVPGSFYAKETNGKNPAVLFFGEKHTEAIGMIETLGLINSVTNDGDTILLEGLDRSYFLVRECALNLIKRVFYAWEWVKLGQPYVSNFAERLNNKEDYDQLFAITKESFDLSELNLTKLRCGFWDDEAALEEDVSYTSLKQRNKSMVEAIKSWRPRSKKIMVMAGADHLPFYDMRDFYDKNSSTFTDLPADLQNFYQLVKNERKMPKSLRSLHLPEKAGSTKPIYDYFQKISLPYGEYIHGSMVH